MCRINCSGGCPECAPDEHNPLCVGLWLQGNDRCICLEIIRCRYKWSRFAMWDREKIEQALTLAIMVLIFGLGVYVLAVAVSVANGHTGGF